MHLYNSPHRRDVSLLNSHPALPNLNIIHPVRYWLRNPRGTFHSGGGPALTPGQFPDVQLHSRSSLYNIEYRSRHVVFFVTIMIAWLL